MMPGLGAPGVFPSPLAGPDRIRPLGARSNRDPGAPPGGVLGHPAGTDRQGAAQSRAAQALGSAAAAAAPAVGDPEQLQPRAAHLGAGTWLEWRSASGTGPQVAAARLTCPSTAQGMDQALCSRRRKRK